MTSISACRRSSLALAVAALLAAGTGAVQAQSLALLPADSGDLVATHATAASRSVQANASREPVAFFQALAPDIELNARHIPNGESREYWQRLDGSQLRDGYALALTAPGAVVMVSPSTRAAPLQREQIVIQHGGASLAAEQATDMLVNADDLRATGMSPTAGSVGFRLHEGLETDATLLIAEADGEYVLHVFEPRSAHALDLTLGTDIVHAGAPITARLAVSGDADITASTALLVAPDGSHHELPVSAERQGTAIRAQAPVEISAQPGLWEVRSSIAAEHGDLAFQRDIRVAFAVVAPTARLDGTVTRNDSHRKDPAMTLSFGVDVASAGRYELRGVLYGQGANGTPTPVGIAHFANWLEPGSGQLSLSFPGDALAGVAPPYELRDLRLTDQSAVAVIERRERALLIR